MASTIVHKRSENQITGQWFGKALPFLPVSVVNREGVWPKLLTLEYWALLKVMPQPLADALMTDWNISHVFAFQDGQLEQQTNAINNHNQVNNKTIWTFGTRQVWNLQGIGFGSHQHVNSKVCENTQKLVFLMESIFVAAATLGKVPPKVQIALWAAELVTGVLPSILCPNQDQPGGAVGTPDPWGYKGRS